jgi:cobalt/nickel transport system permease protein
MHIPDGYLSPATSAVMYAASLPFWYRASRKLKSLTAGRLVPLIALFASVSFVIMMFNVPLPGGTSGHAVGSALAAIVLGPWAAVLAITVALVIQALFFGDGGILALGANVFNMAIAMSFTAYFLYRWISGGTATSSKRRVIAASVAGYVSINVAALLTGIELGIQPVLFHDAAGHALYFPYDWRLSIPVMLIGHLTVAGAVEALATGLVFAWLQRANPELIERSAGAAVGTPAITISRKVWVGLLALVALTPIGLLAPGTAWGEWSRQELQQLGLGYVPAGFDQWSNLWSAPFAHYNLGIPAHPVLGYILSAGFGVIVLLGVIFGIGWLLARKPRDRQTA